MIPNGGMRIHNDECCLDGIAAFDGFSYQLVVLRVVGSDHHHHHHHVSGGAVGNPPLLLPPPDRRTTLNASPKNPANLLRWVAGETPVGVVLYIVGVDRPDEEELLEPPPAAAALLLWWLALDSCDRSCDEFERLLLLLLGESRLASGRVGGDA